MDTTFKLALNILIPFLQETWKARDVHQIRLVSRSWCSLIATTTRHLEIRPGLGVSHVDHVISLSRWFPHTESIVIAGYWFDFRDHHVRQMLGNLRSLQRLEIRTNFEKGITDEAIAFLARTCPRLSTLYWSSCYLLSNNALSSVSLLPNLTSLSLRHNPRWTDSGFTMLFQRCTSLRSLSLHHLEKLSDDSFALVSRSTNLTSLDLVGCRLVTVAAVEKIATACHQLQCVDIQDTPINDQIVSLLARNCPSLSQLHAGLYIVPSLTYCSGSTPLLVASERGHLHVCKVLLAYGASCEEVHADSHVSALYLAALRGHTDVVKYLLEHGASSTVDLPCTGQNTVLHVACQENNIELLELLLQYKANLNVQNETGTTGLLLAAKFGHTAVVERLLQSGADPMIGQTCGVIPVLWLCVEAGQVAMVEVLHAHGLNMNTRDDVGVTPLYVACLHGHVEIVRTLLRLGADVHALRNDGMPCLLAAVHNGHTAVCEVLLQHGAAWSQRFNGSVPLHVAAERGYAAICELFLNAGESIDVTHSTLLFTPLMLAAFQGKTDVVELLLARGANVECVDAIQQTALHRAGVQNQTEIARLLLDSAAGHRLLERADHVGATALWVSAASGSTTTVQLLLSRGANITAFGPHNSSSLYVAAQNGHSDVLQILLGAGAFVDACQADGTSPLLTAVMHGRLECAEVLLKARAFAGCGNRHVAPIHAACDGGNVAMVELLLSHGANIELPTSDCHLTPLYRAALAGHVDLIRLLAARGANVSTKSVDGLTPLFAAVANHYVEVVRVLIELGADPDVALPSGESVLHFAAKCQDAEVFFELLQHCKHVDVKMHANKNLTPLCFAAMQPDGHAICLLLLSRGADVNARATQGQTALYCATEYRLTQNVEVLLTAGKANPNLTRLDGVSPLSLACELGLVDICRLLLAHGANANAYRPDNQVGPLLLASVQGHSEIVEMLLAAGADVHAKGQLQFTPLLGAVEHNHVQVCKMLLKAGARLNDRIADGADSLWMCCLKGYAELCEILLAQGATAHVNERGAALATPLFVAAQGGHLQCIQSLVRCGADVTIPRADGMHPLFIAAQQGHATACKLLLDCGADPQALWNQHSAIHVATANRHADVIRVLMESGRQNVDQICQDMTPLALACAHQLPSAVCASLLLSYGAAVNRLNADRRSPLMLACLKGALDCIGVLIAFDADIRLQDIQGNTALHLAVVSGHRDCASALLHAGADRNVRNNAGFTAQILAQMKQMQLD